jgi:hypothetical protein
MVSRWLRNRRTKEKRGSKFEFGKRKAKETMNLVVKNGKEEQKNKEKNANQQMNPFERRTVVYNRDMRTLTRFLSSLFQHIHGFDSINTLNLNKKREQVSKTFHPNQTSGGKKKRRTMAILT